MLTSSDIDKKTKKALKQFFKQRHSKKLKNHNQSNVQIRTLHQQLQR